MLTKSFTRYVPRTAARGPSSLICLQCQWRGFSTTYHRLAQPPTDSRQKHGTNGNNHVAKEQGNKGNDEAGQLDEKAPISEPARPFANVPQGYGRQSSKFTPMPLSRPIGMVLPPSPGENTGIDYRSLRQRRDDFADYDKHLQRRKQLKSKMAKPYFRDWSNMSLHQGKTFIAPPRLFRGDVSLYFPNLYGRTLLKREPIERDTTPVLEGKAATIVAVFSSAWAESQVLTFMSPKHNPELHKVIQASGGRAQIVNVNVEENSLKYWLIRLFSGRLRRMVGKDNWDKYFIVRRGLSDEIRESIGVLNSKVGYTYLVDRNCRIRWAGSGPSHEEERAGLAKCVERLLAESDKMAEARAEESQAKAEEVTK